MRILFALTFFTILSMQVKSQDQNQLDSLCNVYKNAKHDTTRIELLIDIGDLFEYDIPDSAIYYYQRAVDMAESNLGIQKPRSASVNLVEYKISSLKSLGLRYIGIILANKGDYDKAIENYLNSLNIEKELGDKKGISACYNNIGNVYKNQGLYDKAIENYNNALIIFSELDDKNKMAICHMNIGLVHYNQGNYDKAIEYYMKALKIFEEIGDKKGMSLSYSNIGNVHTDQGLYDKAEEYYLKALVILQELGNKYGIANCYNNIGGAHFDQKNYDKAEEYYLKALEIFNELGDKRGMSICYNNLGNIHSDQELYDKAVEYYIKASKIDNELDDKKGMAVGYCNIASLHIRLSSGEEHERAASIAHLDSAILFGNKAYNLALEIDALPLQNDAAAQLQKAYTKLGKYKEAIKYAEIYITTQDSMFNEEKTKSLAEMQTKYETEKKELEIEKMAKQKELDNKTIEAQQAENRKQFIIILASVIGFIVVLVFSIVLLRMFRQKRKDNILLADQKAEIEEKNKDIMDSITYAKRIQSAILPPQKLVKEYLQNSFILYKPKDIVAGDFYWMEQKDGKILFAVADCTGHGVPGAMVSVICNNGLNRSVREYGITDPGLILDKTREIVIQEFEKSEEEVKDGMDIAICSLDGNRLQYAGAHNPLWIIRNGELLETKADKQAIGNVEKPSPFTTYTIELQKEDSIYIFSDGYVDQFGGGNGKKFKSKAFKDLLLDIQTRTMEDQREYLDTNFESWKGRLDQIDDVTVIGLKI